MGHTRQETYSCIVTALARTIKVQGEIDELYSQAEAATPGKVLLIALLALVMSIGHSYPVSAGANVWTPIGPEGGIILALAIDPQTPTTMYAGTFGSGVFKSTDKWAYHQSDGRFKIGAYAHAALDHAGLSFILTDEEKQAPQATGSPLRALGIAR